MRNVRVQPTQARDERGRFVRHSGSSLQLIFISGRKRVAIAYIREGSTPGTNNGLDNRRTVKGVNRIKRRFRHSGRLPAIAHLIS